MAPDKKPYYVFLKVEGLPSGLNSGKTRYARASENKVWARKMAIEISKGKKPAKPLRLVKLRFIRYSTHEMDWDNLVSTFKPLQDALIREGIILDDSPKVIPEMPIYDQGTAPRGKGYCTVEVWELGKDEAKQAKKRRNDNKNYTVNRGIK
jgi:hypothetical protein